MFYEKAKKITMTAKIINKKAISGPSSYKLDLKPREGIQFTLRKQLELWDAIRFQSLQTPSAQQLKVDITSIEKKPRAAQIAGVPKEKFVKVKVITEKIMGADNSKSLSSKTSWLT